MTFLIILSVGIAGCVNLNGKSATSSATSPTLDQSCFKFSDDRVIDNMWTGNGCWFYQIAGNVTNICQKNFVNVKVKTKFYDKDNILTGTDVETIENIQHGTTVGFGGSYCAGSGMNNATRYELGIEGYHLQSS